MAPGNYDPRKLSAAASAYSRSASEPPPKSAAELELEVREFLHDPRLLTFFETAVDGIWMWDLTQDGVSWVTPAFARVFGYELDEIEQGAEFWRERTHPDDWDSAMRAIERAIRTDGVYDHIQRIRHKRGHWVWTRSIGIIFRDHRDRPVRGFGIQHDVSELMATKQRLERESTRDPLTGLLNRRGIDQALLRVVEQVRRLECQAYAVLLDLDDFKRVNDDYGHAIGDEAIRQTAECLRESVRVMDECGRLGGDEFVVFLLARTRKEAERAASRIHEAIAEQTLVLGSDTVTITASSALLPICTLDGPCIDRIDTLLRLSTPYLNRSKTNGKNRTAVMSTIPPPPDAEY